MTHEHYAYILPDAEARQSNAQKMHAMHGAPLRKLQETTAETLPYSDTDEEVSISWGDAAHPQRRSYTRCALAGLTRLKEALAPTAELTIVKDGNDKEDYFRLSEYDDEHQPTWVIAEHQQNGYALYIWRRDRSDTDPDTALATTRRDALAHGCLRIIHLSNMDTATRAEIDTFYQEKVADALTA
ncbi:MAG: hypothetical protein ABIP74_04670 [Candidatus Saccharimonas sp.]